MFTHIKKFYWFAIIISLLLPQTAQAASGTPNSPYFGYGARLYLNGDDPLAAIQEAGHFNLDWIAIDFDWQKMQPDANEGPNWDQFDQAMMAASENQVSVLISVIRAPAWVMSENGPHPQKTADLASKLVRRYAGTLLALELFPGANTNQGWGAQPNPAAYAHLLETTSQTIGQDVFLVGAGLMPVDSVSDDMNDVEFLSQLYAVGASEFMPVVGLRLPPIGNDPLTPLHEADGLALRHYEDIHNTMIENGHNSGLIWITGLSWDENILGSAVDQANWLKQAYLLLRSQLYIGAAFFDGLQPSSQKAAKQLLVSGEHHPGFDELTHLIALDNNNQTLQISFGKTKFSTWKNYSKGE